MEKRKSIKLLFGVAIAVIAIGLAIGLLLLKYNKNQKEDAIHNVITSIQKEIDKLEWEQVLQIGEQGNYLKKGLKIQAPFMVRYSYSDKDNSGLKIYTEKEGKLDATPLLLSTKSENNISMHYCDLDSVDIKVESKGVWAMSFENLDISKFPSKQLKLKIDSLTSNLIIDSLTVADTIKSLIDKRAKYLYKHKKTDFSDLSSLLEKKRISNLKWHAIISDRGEGDFESMDFYLPACKVKITAGLYPGSGKSVRGGVSLEGKGKRQSWDVVPGSWYMTGYRWNTFTKVITIPEGYYWIDTSSDGFFFFEVSALY